ncbi:MAG: 3-hexulose-6-phosphate synthase [SAR324 cluster bacterium]|nr:3-hexulose-6-phosphate synthase [SAR324 cluster bacterium]
MKLQLAYDLGTYEELYPFMEEIEEAIDIIEIGTPVILREGVSQIENIKKRFPDKLIFADLKIMDAGKLEADIGFQAGADMVSVLGLASKKTIEAAKNSAILWNRKIMIDMINLEEPIMKWADFMEMGMDYGCLHTAHDDVTDGKNTLETVEKFHEAHGGQQISVAGGIDPEKIRNLKSCQPEILVVGSYITTAADPRKAVKTIRQVMNEISI